MLAPGRLVDRGAGSGIVDVGTEKLAEMLRRRIEAADAEEIRQERRRLIGPVARGDVPDGNVKLDVLDPVARDHIARAVRERKRSIRHCYEARGLAADATRMGRLVLELTLLPSGHVRDVATQVSDAGLALVDECVKKRVGEWYLGGGLVKAPQRLSFPFLLAPKRR